VWLFYQLATSLSRSAWVALLASLPIAYHAQLGYLAWGGAFIYDVLCWTFYISALLVYVARRRAGKMLGFWTTCLFLLLYIFALDAKEMGVTLPAIVLSYELLFHKFDLDWRRWMLRLLPVALSGVVTLIFIFGKTGSGSLTDLDAYRPVFTFAR